MLLPYNFTIMKSPAQYITFILFFFACVTTVSAQPDKNKQSMMKKIEALKVEFLTSKLDLSPSEAQQFWPVYNVYQKEIGSIFKERHKAKEAHKKTGTPFDDLNYESRILEVKKKYKKDFQNVLPKEKVEALYNAEREFREELINNLRKRRAENNE